LARKTGFLHSTGEFITFIDGDDVFTPDAIATLLKVYQYSQADISMAGYLTVDDNLQPGLPLPYVPHHEPETFLYSHDAMVELLLLGFPAWQHNNNPTTAYCKLFRRRVLEGLDWSATNYSLAEDLFFSLLTFAAAHTSAVVNEIILYYRYHDGGKSRVSNRIYRFNGKEITVLQFCRNFAELATAVLPPKFTWAITKRFQQLCDYYFVEETDFATSLLHLNAQKDNRIAQLELENAAAQERIYQIYNSETWKLGKLATSPLRATRWALRKARRT